MDRSISLLTLYGCLTVYYLCLLVGKEDEALEELMTSEREYHSVLAPPQNKWYLPFYIIMLPALILLFITIPDFRRPGCCWRRLYGLTLLVCVIYIALTAYVLVWMISIIGASNS